MSGINMRFLLEADIDANRPTLTAYDVGAIFPCTDLNTLERWNGSGWDVILTGALGDELHSPLTAADLPVLETVLINSNTTLDDTHIGKLLLLDASGGNFTITMPPASVRRLYQMILSEDIAAHLYIDFDSGDTIGFNLAAGPVDIVTIIGPSKGTRLDLLSDGGTNWIVLLALAIAQP